MAGLALAVTLPTGFVVNHHRIAQIQAFPENNTCTCVVRSYKDKASYLAGAESVRGVELSVPFDMPITFAKLFTAVKADPLFAGATDE